MKPRSIEGAGAMSLVFEHVLTEGIGQLSYLIGDSRTGTAAVIDPRLQVEVYLSLARQHKVAITHVFETHIHADFVSGARELAARTGTASVCASVEGGASYGGDVQPARDGDVFEFGSVVLRACRTPGHTPEHLSYLVADQKRPDAPWGVFSGDSLFVNSAGRPDLLGDDQAETLADQLYDTLYGFYLKLDDGVMLLPGHGHGSACGADIADRRTSTIGQERASNPFLKYDGRRAAFIKAILADAPPEPSHYKRLKRLNAHGIDAPRSPAVIPGLPPKAFQAAVAVRDAVVVDTRSMLAFGGGHIAGALNIGGSPMLSLWAGWILDPDRPILLVLEDDSELEKIAPLFARVGFFKFAGYLVGGMNAWSSAGLPVATIAQLTIQDLRGDASSLRILDVRAPREWAEGRIPGAQHVFVPELRDRLNEWDKDQPIVTYCNSGYRASLAASILQARGFTRVRNLPGSWQAWRSAGYPIEK